MKGICFKEPLFLSTIEGKKTETRRIAKGKPRYKVGEILYLKEPYIFYDEKYMELKTTHGLEIAYKYGNNMTLEEITGEEGLRWKNKLFMPELAARYFIKITAVRTERLQDISEEACLREGIIMSQRDRMKVYFIPGGKYPYVTARSAYEDLINSINGKSTWDDNPEVHVYGYELTNIPAI